jgi:uncharacterized protein YndB with AHSA1/START domain
MKILLLALVLFAALALLVVLVGHLLPRAHTATRTATYRRPPAELYAAVRDWAALPAWRTGVRSVELLPATAARPGYRETSGHGTVAYELVEDRPGERLVVRIADDSLPYGGTWTFAFAPAPGGATLRLTEHGFVRPALFRFLARFVFGHTANMETYLRDLGRKFGETTQPQP